MLYHAFGLTRLEERLPSPVQLLAEQARMKLDSITAQLLLLECYETVYQIYNHEKEDRHRPLAVVAMHQKEDNYSFSPIQRIARRYRTHRINEAFGLNLMEFLALPRDYVEMLFDVTDEVIQEEAPGVNAAMAALEKGKS